MVSLKTKRPPLRVAYNEKSPHREGSGNYMFEVLDKLGNVIVVFGNRKRGAAFVIDEAKLKTAPVYQRKHRSHWLIRFIFPLLVPVDAWIAERFR
jgi:hypothetical protein